MRVSFGGDAGDAALGERAAGLRQQFGRFE